MPPWLRPTLSFFLFLWAVVVGYHPLGVRAATTVVQSTDPAIEYVGVWERLKLNSTTAYAVSNTTGSKAVSTNTAAFSSTVAPTALTSTTSSTSIFPTSSRSTPDAGLAQGRTTALSKGATIGGGIAGTLGFLLLVGGLCCVVPASNDPKAPLGIHNVTSQVTVGSDPFAADPAARLRRGPPLYIPVASASDLSTRNTQYTPTLTQGPSRAGYDYGYGYGYQNEKYGYGMDDVPLQSPISPVSASNLLDTPTRNTFASQTTQPDTPVEVRRMDADGRRREADGGVRIAGGRPGQRVDDTDDSFLDLAERKSIGSTLPPAYDFDE